MARIIEKDNFDQDDDTEKFVNLPIMSNQHAQKVADAINAGFSSDYPRYWRVVPNDYELRVFKP